MRRRSVSVKKRRRSSMVSGRSRSIQRVRPVVDAVEPGVQAGAELDDGAVGVPAQEVADELVEDRGAQDRDPAAPAAAVRGGVEVDRGEDLGGLGIADQGVFAGGLARAVGQGDEQGLLDRAQLDFHRFRHAVRYSGGFVTMLRGNPLAGT
jgi:hypothetical protein